MIVIRNIMSQTLSQLSEFPAPPHSLQVGDIGFERLEQIGIEHIKLLRRQATGFFVAYICRLQLTCETHRMELTHTSFSRLLKICN